MAIGSRDPERKPDGQVVILFSNNIVTRQQASSYGYYNDETIGDLKKRIASEAGIDIPFDFVVGGRRLVDASPVSEHNLQDVTVSLFPAKPSLKVGKDDKDSKDAKDIKTENKAGVKIPYPKDDEALRHFLSVETKPARVKQSDKAGKYPPTDEYWNKLTAEQQSKYIKEFKSQQQQQQSGQHRPTRGR